MNKADGKTLALFQCEYNRSIEENFAQVLGERSDLQLFFINENQALTDGRNIVVDPAWRELFCDDKALRDTEKHLKLDNVISSDHWLALRMITRAQNIHETLHILYTTFPRYVLSDSRGSTKARGITLSLIDNIIEDAFIEAAACSIYDNLERYLQWWRMAICCSNVPAQGTVDRAFSELCGQEEAQPVNWIAEYLNYMGFGLLYPMVEQGAPAPEIAEYVERTKELFSQGSLCGIPEERYTYSQRVFDIVEPLINDELDMNIPALERMLCDPKTHSTVSSSIVPHVSQGRHASVKRRLFTDENGTPITFGGQGNVLAGDIARFRQEKDAALIIVSYQGGKWEFSGHDFDCARIHQGIKIEVTKPRVNLNLKKAYQNIYSQYHINISSYNSRFTQLLKGTVDMREERQIFGAGVSSRRLGDVKKRYWYRNVKGTDVPDIALLLLIDGSGSMAGPRREASIVSSVILHEVLRKQGIEHAIVEHRAIYGKPLLECNILVGFNAREEEKYNLLMLEAYEGNRDGLSIYWAERYLQENSYSENKLIIVLADGVPDHSSSIDDNYVPPVSIKDTYNAVRKITRRGTQIIAVALDTPDIDDWEAEDGEAETEFLSCYELLKEMYPEVVACTNLKRLTGQLLGLISRELR